MALRVEFCCSHCKTRVNFNLVQSREWVCPSCQQKLSLPQNGEGGADTVRVFHGEPPAVRSSPKHYHE